jgi:alkylation response protein AidB-like acyl-CoA dehydrogenase
LFPPAQLWVGAGGLKEDEEKKPLNTLSKCQMAHYSLYSAQLLTRVYRALVKTVHYVGNRVQFGIQSASQRAFKVQLYLSPNIATQQGDLCFHIFYIYI